MDKKDNINKRVNKQKTAEDSRADHGNVTLTRQNQDLGQSFPRNPFLAYRTRISYFCVLYLDKEMLSYPTTSLFPTF